MPQPTDLRAPLERLLTSLFDPDSLRRHLRHGPEGELIDAEIPRGVAMSQMVHAAVDVLLRRGLIDIAFFDRLRVGIPGRAQEILNLCGRWISVRPQGTFHPPAQVADSALAQAIARQNQTYLDREECIMRGEDTAAIDRELLELKRIIRRGPQLHPGESLLAGRYGLHSQLGSGGYGTVWRAYDRETGRPVALKVLHSHLMRDHSHRERFVRGARTMMRLNHPNIVRVLREPCEDEGFLFYVMDLIGGECLHRAVLGQRIDLKGAIDVLVSVCDALECAHERGYVHRDVKPQNILIGPKRHAYLTDFDLIRGNDTTGGTNTDANIGTRYFTAPEDASRADTRADIYSLGMTLLFAALRRVLKDDDFMDVRNHDLAVSQALSVVIYKAAAKHRDRRYATVAELKLELKAIMVDRGEQLKHARKANMVDRGEEQTQVTHPLREDDRSAAQATPTPPPPDAPIDREYALVVVHGGKFGERHAIPEQGVSIGRSSKCDICIAQDNVSRHHAVLRVVGGRVRIRDDTSANGTMVNGHKVRDAWLRSGDLIQIGGMLFKFLSAAVVDTLYEEELQLLKTLDGLTQLSNNRSFTRTLEQEITRARRDDCPLSLILFDIDHFVQFNARYGVRAGDAVLSDIATILKGLVREIDVVARYIGDAFAIMLPSMSLTAAAAFAERLRQTIADATFVAQSRPVPITVSVGVAQLIDADTSFEDVLGRTEARVIAAKHTGRNHVEVDWQDVHPARPGPH